MRTGFISGLLLCLIVLGMLLAGSLTGIRASAQTMEKPPANELYSISYAAGGKDDSGHFMGGTETMALIGFQNKLYAGIGYWMDRPKRFHSDDPKSGPQILVLDSKDGKWQQEAVFRGGGQAYRRVSTMAVAQFHNYDAAGKATGLLAEILVAGLDGNKGAVHTQKSSGVWENTQLPGESPIRSLAMHYDPSVNADLLFVGAGGGKDRSDVQRAIYSGAYDPHAPGQISWNTTPENIDISDRVISMVDCGGYLFAAAKPSIYRRNDQTKKWEVVYTYPIDTHLEESPLTSGFRGMACIDAPNGAGKALLSEFEGNKGEILRIDWQTGSIAANGTIELDSRNFLTDLWKAPPAVPDVIAGYSNIPLVSSVQGNFWLFGLDTKSPHNPNPAWFLSRATGDLMSYQLHEVPTPRWPYPRYLDTISPLCTTLWAVRIIAISPFPEDQGQVLYMGGFDAHQTPAHNTAWIYRVGVDTALKPPGQDGDTVRIIK